MRGTIAADAPVREAGLFGVHGGHVNVTDGRYVYMRAPAGGAAISELSEYTLMPAHMRRVFDVSELQDIELQQPFSFTKGCRTMRIRCKNTDLARRMREEYGHLLFDLANDPEQQRPIRDPQIEQRMIARLTRLMRENDAPKELFNYLGLAEASSG